MAEKTLSHCDRNLQLTIQIWIGSAEDIESLLAQRAHNSAEIARLIQQLREQAESEEERQLLDAATPRWSFSESYGELLRQIVDGQVCAEAGAETNNVLLPLLLDHASWKAFVEFLRAQVRTPRKPSKRHDPAKEAAGRCSFRPQPRRKPVHPRSGEEALHNSR